MLGVMRTHHAWSWAACGKHPGARDFFRIGPDMPLVRRFSEWAEQGYQALTSQGTPGQKQHSWRFWARGGSKGTLVCGLIRDSSDTLGRCYPLLIMGSGPLHNWEACWDLLPYACEKTWSEIEYISTRLFQHFDIIRKNIDTIASPEPRWTDFRKQQHAVPGMEATAVLPTHPNDSDNFIRTVHLLSERSDGIMSLDQKSFHDQSDVVSCIHALLMRQAAIVPNAVFVGGTVDKTFLALFQRPLVTADFVRLWSLPVVDDREPGTGTS